VPVVYKQLGRSAPAAITLTTVYTVPAGTASILSTITVCNRSSTATTFRLSHAVAGAADANDQYFAYDAPIAGNSTAEFLLGITMAATDVLRAYVGAATVTILVWGEDRS